MKRARLEPLRLERSELVHSGRPSADALLPSVAEDHRGRRRGIVRSGAAIIRGAVDHVLPLSGIGAAALGFAGARA